MRIFHYILCIDLLPLVGFRLPTTRENEKNLLGVRDNWLSANINIKDEERASLIGG